jgi:hypothetical protein
VNLLPLNSQENAAVSWIFANTHLGKHPQASRAYNADAHTLDFDALEPAAYNWSTGEQIMLSLIRQIALDVYDFDTTRLMRLDTKTRFQCLHAITLAKASK